MPTNTPDSPRHAGSLTAVESPSDQTPVDAEPSFDEGRFRTLLRRWNRHQDLRRDGADIATLSRSAEVLDAAREALRSAPYGRAA